MQRGANYSRSVDFDFIVHTQLNLIVRFSDEGVHNTNYHVTVDLEIFGVKIFSSFALATEIRRAKIYSTSANIRRF